MLQAKVPELIINWWIRYGTALQNVTSVCCTHIKNWTLQYFTDESSCIHENWDLPTEQLPWSFSASFKTVCSTYLWCYTCTIISYTVVFTLNCQWVFSLRLSSVNYVVITNAVTINIPTKIALVVILTTAIAICFVWKIRFWAYCTF